MKNYCFLLLLTLCLFSCVSKTDNSFTYEICNINAIEEDNLLADAPCQDITYGYGDTHYFKVTVHSSINQELVLKINSVLVKSLKLWIIDEKDIITAEEYGWANNNIPENISYGYGKPFNIKAGQEVTIYFTIYDEYWPINQSIKIYNSDTFQKVYDQEKIIKVVCRSLILITVFLSIIGGLFLKKRVFVIYVLCAILYVSYPDMEYGFFANLFNLSVAIHTKYLLLIISGAYHYVAFELYSHIIFQQKNRLGKYGLIFEKSILPIIILHFIAIFFSETEFMIESQKFLINLAFLLIAVSDIGIISLLYLGIKEKRKMVYYALGIFCITTMTVILFSVLPNANLIEKREINRYIFHIIISFDMTAYLILMFYQTYIIYKEKVDLEKEQLKISQKYTSALIEGQEKERKQIKAQLDEEINHNLDSIQKADNMDTPSILSSITNTISKVRSISHYLVSPDFENESLYDVIEDLCLQKKYSSAKIHLSIPTLQPKTDLLIKNQIYRIIQALLDLSLEHPHHQTIHLSLLAEDDQVDIYFENNIELEFKNTNTLQRLKNRVFTINGKIDINTSEIGTYISIEGIRI
ncbi:hypothetical protein [Flammeovirga sp. EKP202]|uniref:hypothetical protein n=1 Tax=Flammeovirga sp. EKP202 TaxID=2770592 RepID=UPI00165F1E9E|nr:hypothetical protein [Flammeovirga sp. EKP202]MBD0401754.1 hypothetical protein [Flammeovirga sp. EKP202]